MILNEQKKAFLPSASFQKSHIMLILSRKGQGLDLPQVSSLPILAKTKKVLLYIFLLGSDKR